MPKYVKRCIYYVEKIFIINWFNNDINSTSSKNISAKKLGVPIITEENFKNFLTN